MRHKPSAPSVGAATESRSRPIPLAESAAAVPSPLVVAPVGRKQRNRVRNASRNAQRPQSARLTDFGQLLPLTWSPRDCIKTTHALQRMAEGRMTEPEFQRLWTEGEWRPDEQADTFIATRGRQQIVVAFEEETPKLVTPKFLADHQVI